MDLQKILVFLSDLTIHNSREWYHEHKLEYQAANAEFENLVTILNEKIAMSDPNIICHDPKKLTFKLMRDTRFSMDKSPYNPCFRANIAPHGKDFVPVGYFIQIKPNSSFLGGGIFADMFKDATSMIRKYIAEHGAEFEKIVDQKSFKDNFTVLGTSLKKVPAPYEASHPQAEFLKNKSWYLEYPVADNLLIQTDDFINLALEKFLLMKDFNDYLNKALVTFKMPSRLK